MILKEKRPNILATYTGFIILICNIWLITTKTNTILFTFHNPSDYYLATGIYSIIALALRIGVAIWVSKIAEKQNRIKTGWIIIALILPTPTLIIIGLLSPLEPIQKIETNTISVNDMSLNIENEIHEPLNELHIAKKNNVGDHSKLTFYFSIISLLGVIALFILYFFTGKSGINENVMNIKNKSVSIGYVNTDTVYSNYLLAQDLEDSITAMQTKAEEDFNTQQSAYQASVLAYQKKVKNNEITIAEATKTETALTQQKDYLETLYESLSTELTTSAAKLQTTCLDSILNYIKRYNKKYNFDYILQYSSTGGILFANDSLDITNDVLKGLNEEYEKE